MGHPGTSSEDSSSEESEYGLEDIFEVEEEPATNNVTAKFCELCDGATDYHTLECKKVDNCNLSDAEKRRIKQYRVKYYKKSR